jgi:5-methylcytosine-specific restriction endonuclease McrA
MIIVLHPNEDAEAILVNIKKFLAARGMNISESKTKVTNTTDGFDFLGWNFKVQSNGKLRSIPSEENYKAFRKKVKKIVNCKNIGATVKAKLIAPLVRGWRNYHKHCSMHGTKESLVFMQRRAFRVFNKETKQNRYSSKQLLDKAFPKVSTSEHKHIKVKGNKSPYDGDMLYWSKRKSKLYEGDISKALHRQNHKCKTCGLMFIGDEKIHLHHVDGNHDNWKRDNLVAIHESCHDSIHHTRKAQA